MNFSFILVCTPVAVCRAFAELKAMAFS